MGVSGFWARMAFVDGAQLGHADANVANDDEQIGRLVADGLLEPGLLDGLADGLHDGVGGVAGKVKEEAKGDHVGLAVLGLEGPVALGGHGQLLAGDGVEVVEVGGQVLAAEVGHGQGMFAVGSVGLVQLVVAGADDVDVLLLEDVVGVLAFGIGSVVEAVAFDAVAGVDEDQVDVVLVGPLAQVVGQGDIVAPVGRVLGSER